MADSKTQSPYWSTQVSPCQRISKICNACLIWYQAACLLWSYMAMSSFINHFNPSIWQKQAPSSRWGTKNTNIAMCYTNTDTFTELHGPNSIPDTTECLSTTQSIYPWFLPLSASTPLPGPPPPITGPSHKTMWWRPRHLNVWPHKF